MIRAIKFVCALFALAVVARTAQLTVNLGNTPNDGQGDNLRTAFGKVNTNFNEVYGFLRSNSVVLYSGPTNGWSTNVLILTAGNNITITTNNGTNLVITASALVGSVPSDLTLNSLRVTNSVTNLALTASRIVATDANKSLTSSISSANLLASVTDPTGSGLAVFGTSPTITTPTISGAISFPDGTRQTFNPDATTPGLNVGANAGDPSTPSNGDLWYDSTGGLLRARINGSTVSLGAGGAGTPGGSDTYVQFNDGGSFGGDSGMVYNKTTDALTVAGRVTAGSVSVTTVDLVNSLTVTNSITNSTLTASRVVATDSNKVLASTFASAALSGSLSDETGSGFAVFDADPRFSSSVQVVGPLLASSLTVTNSVTNSALTAFRLVATDANKVLSSTITSANLASSISDETGSGLAVFDTSPRFSSSVQVVGPLLADSLTVTNSVTNSALTASRLVATDANKVLSSSISSANIAASVTDETGTGALVFGTSPSITTGINDSNGNELFTFSATSSAVNELSVTNAATGTGPVLSVSGNDSNIDLRLRSKGTGIIKTEKAFLTVPAALTYSGTNITTDVSLANHYRVTLTNNVTLLNPTNSVDGMRVVWELIQDATGSRTLSLDTKFAFGTDITSITLTTTASKRDFLTCIYNSTADKWHVVAFVKGY